MSYEPKDMSGSLFRNDKREKDTHPHAKGDCVIDGKAYWISAWTKDGKNGKFQSLAFKPKEAKPEAARSVAPDFADDIPF